PVAGAAPEGPPCRRAARPRAVARHAGHAGVACRLDRRPRTDGRDRRRLRAPALPRRVRGGADGVHAPHPARLPRLPRLAPRPRLARATGRLPRPHRVRARDRRATRPPAHTLLMSVLLIGISHRVASVELRERVALGTDEASAHARELAGDRGEAVCLSTCNRTELYLAGEETLQVAAERAVFALAARAGLDEHDLRAVLYRLEDEAAGIHLFRVAAGLDSMVPGEGEILGQVREAFEVGATGPLLDRLFSQAIHAGKKVRTETAIAESPASVSSAAAALAEQVFGDLAGCRVLLIGAGKIGELAARNLVSLGAELAVVANRSLDKANELAARFGGGVASLDDAVAELARIDVVVSSTSAPGYVLTRADAERALPGRKGRPLFLIDIAVPRDL